MSASLKSRLEYRMRSLNKKHPLDILEEGSAVFMPYLSQQKATWCVKAV